MAKIDMIEASPTGLAVDAAVEAAQQPRHSNRLGGSTLGNECERSLWYAFRWAYPPERFTAAQLRIFRAGHRIEAEMIEDLKLRFNKQDERYVQDLDPATGKQFEVTDIGGHFVGKFDGLIRGVIEAPVTVHLLECKSHKRSSFLKLEKGVAISKPDHHVQMQTYMLVRGLTRALYVAECKDDSQRYYERVRLDATFAMEQMAKAKRVITAERAPPKAWASPEEKGAFPCSWCKAKEICHNGGQPERNCRTCLHVTPELNGDADWTCARWKKKLTVDEQRSGCANHIYNPSLVPGEVIEVNEEQEWIDYRMPDGSVFHDGMRKLEMKGSSS